jgi:tetratricopeptide (TPR) repeat protein
LSVRAYVEKIRARLRTHGAAVGICIAVVVLALAAHSVVLDNDFINYDDPVYVTGNAQVGAGLTVGGIKTAFTRFYDNNWIPLVWLSLMLDHDLFGMNPAGYHAVNLLMHAANAALLFIVMFKMTGALWPAALTGALFAAHPASVESVAWAAERKDVLSTLLWLLTMYFYAGYAKAKADGSPVGRTQARKNYILTIVAFTLGLMSKQMLVTLPFVFLLLDWWPLNRFGGDGIESAPRGNISAISGTHKGSPYETALRDKVSGKSTIPVLLIEKLPLMALAALFIFVVIHAQQHSMINAAALSIRQRFANALLSYVVYIGELVWPADLCVFYPAFRVYPAKAVACALGLAAVTAVVLYYARRLRWLPVGWFWYLGTLAPVIGLVQVGMQARADRYLYVPRIGIFIMAAWGLYTFAAKFDIRKYAAAFAALVVVIFSALTYVQAGHWKNNQTLYTHCLSVTESNFVVMQSLAFHYQSQGDIDKALHYYFKALEVKPDFANSRVGIGNIFRDRGDVAGALVQYELALKYVPHYGDAHNNIANIYAARGGLGRALEHYLMAVKDKPGSAEINYNVADTLVGLGRAEESLKYYRRALEIDPYLAEAHNNIGYVLNSMGKTDEAEMHLRKAVEIKPDFAHAHFTLGIILLSRQDFSRAEIQFLKAVETKPDFFEAHNALGVALLKLGRYDEAARHFRRAVEINPGFAEARSNLAALSQNPGVK